MRDSITELAELALSQNRRLLNTLAQLEWQLEKEREHNASLLNELERYRAQLSVAQRNIKRLEGTPDVGTFH